MLKRIIQIVLVFVGYILSTTSGVASEDDNVVHLQLRWHHQFQFAGYYAALEKGFYAEEGLKVELHSGSPQHQPVQEVLSGRAQYAEGNSEVLYHRLKGEPLVALAAIFQHSPSVLLTLQSSGIHSVHDLVDKRVMLAAVKEDADFLAMFLNEGISPSNVNIIPSSYQLEDLISGRVDAFNSYSTNEPFYLKQQNIRYNIISPTNYSVDFYSDILFTTEEELRNHPQRVRAMRTATLKGWRYALDNPEEIIELLKTKYQINKSREHLRFEANAMRALIFPDLIQIGHMNPARWHHMAETFVKAGLVEDMDRLAGFVYEDKRPEFPAWIMPFLFGALILASLTSIVSFYLHRFNRRMLVAQQDLQESEARFKALSDAAYGGIAIHHNGIILECNKGLSDITGFSYQELIGMNGFQLIAPEFLDRVHEKVRVGFANSYEVIGILKDGTRCPFSVKGKNIIYKGQDARVIEFVDISERKKTDEQLKLAASVFTHASEGIVITDSDAKIIDVNDTFSRITGYKREEAIGQNPRFLKSGRHSDEFYQEMWACLLNQKEWSGKLWNRRKNGEIFVELVTISAVTNGKGETKHYVALFSDITSMMQHQQQLEHIAHFDPLTGLPNRMLFADRLSYAMNQCERREQLLAVAYIDLDGFKEVNDTHGHSAGDELLTIVANRLGQSMRDGDTIARIGGDEFVALMVDLDKVEDCELVLHRLLQASMSAVTVEGKELQVSASIGVAFYPHGGIDSEQLIRNADLAMYAAKNAGKNRFHIYSDGLIA